MRNLRRYWPSALILVAFGAAGAQPTGGGDQGLDLAAGGVTVKISAEEMTSRADSMIQEMEAANSRITSLEGQARQDRDIIKLNCVNDKLVQVKQLLNIADNAKSNLTGAIANRNESDRYHQYSMITVADEKVRTLRDEAEACLGEELVIKGPATISVEAPDVPDDPTRPDPFALVPFEIERPTYATPFL